MVGTGYGERERMGETGRGREEGGGKAGLG